MNQLESIWHRRTRRFSRAGYVLVTRIGTTVLGIVLLFVLIAAGAALISTDAVQRGPYGRYALAGAAFVAALVIAIAGLGIDPLLELLDRSHERGHGVHEIWARIDGQDVLIFSTLDALRFGKVYRALQRAAERQAP